VPRATVCHTPAPQGPIGPGDRPRLPIEAYLADAIGKSAESASRWVTDGASRRRTDTGFAALAESQDAALSRRSTGGAGNNECNE